MEFLRFGSSIPGSYWGCCACDIIQDFNCDPDAKASIQLVNGDGGYPVIRGEGFVFAGPTWRDIFWQRIRFGTFDSRDMPNHAFLAIMTANQLEEKHGKAWLAILKEAGFEFIRTVSNSVYDGQELFDGTAPESPSCDCGEDDYCDMCDEDDYCEGGSHPNYLFGLFRNIGRGAIEDPFTPPKAWTDLPSVKPEFWDFDKQLSTEEFANLQRETDRAIWDKIGPPKLLSEKEVEEAKAPVWYAGKRSEFPQQKKEDRQRVEAAKAKREGKDTAPAISLKGTPTPTQTPVAV